MYKLRSTPAQWIWHTHTSIHSFHTTGSMWDNWFDRKIWHIVQKHLHYLRIKEDQSDYLWQVWFPTVINRKTRVLFPGPRRAKLQRGLEVFWREFGVHRVNTLWGSEWSSCCRRTKTGSELSHTCSIQSWQLGSVCPIFQQLLQFTAHKCSHMVISSLTFPCEYGSREPSFSM